MISCRNYNKDYADDLALLANTVAQAESLLYSLKQAEGIRLHVNVNKTEYMCFKQQGAISTLSWRPLKNCDKFTYLSSNISSTESDVNMRLTKEWTAVDRLSIIPELSDKIKQDFF